MAHKTYTTAVVLIPPQEMWPPIQAIRQRYDRHVRRWMPHITLLYPFRPAAEFDEVAPAMAHVCAGLKPFTVELPTFHAFAHARDHYTLWLAPEPREAVIALQAALGRVVPECDDVQRHPQGFTPHLSVGQIRGREAARQLLADLHREWTFRPWKVSDISFLWRHEPPDDVFRVGNRLRLGSDSI